MLKRYIYILLTVILLISNTRTAIAQERNSLSISTKALILRLDIKSGRKTLDSILNLAGLTEQSAEKVIKGDLSPLNKDGWNLVSREDSQLHFEKSLSALGINPQDNPYEITMRMPHVKGKPGYPGIIKYGVNKFARITVMELASGMTRFILPDYTIARRVFLSGSFNDWSTLSGKMVKTEGGWMLDVKLKPGAYEYKYIIDGHWMTDPNNLLRTSDGGGNSNSVYYKYNYTFKLQGHASAQRVMLAGDFNNWDASELVMNNTDGVWEKQLYLGENKFAYRFLVDGEWITDPSNSLKEKDDKGNTNSILNLGETVSFKLKGYPNAQTVFIAGDFNDWKPGELSMKKVEGGWATQLVLASGNHQYKFIVDGQWITDPDNPNTATTDGKTNSFIVVRPNYTFRLKGYPNAKSVRLAGNFNNWNFNGLTLVHNGDEWTISLYLNPGKYLYKFVADNQWLIDPGNKYREQDGGENWNSVLWMQ